MPINLVKPDARWETVGPELIMTSAEASHKAVIHIVDDDASLCFGLGELFETIGLATQCYRSAREFSDSDLTDLSSCIVIADFPT